MTKRTKIMIAIAAVLLTLALIAAGGALLFHYLYRIPFEEAENHMDTHKPLVLREQEDGTLHIAWEAGTNIDRYRVELLRYDTVTDPETGTPETVETVLHSMYVENATQCILPVFPRDQELTISITGEKAYHIPRHDKWRDSEESVAVTAVFTPPEIANLTWSADADTKTVDIQFSLSDYCVCQIYTVSDSGEIIHYRTVPEESMDITFGEGMEFPLPSHDIPQSFAFSVDKLHPEYEHYGLITDTITVVREDLLGTTLELECIDLGNNVFSFTWNETKGETYRFQQLQPDGETWTTLYETGRSGERCYTTGHLPRYSNLFFRVVAVGGQTLPDSEFAATPAQTYVFTGASIVYATIWPQKDLDVYSDSQKTAVIGKVEACGTYCVLDYVDGMFQIRIAQDTYGYIDSNYCLINLPDMIGDICSYEITNSFSSLYMVHGYEIPTVTGTVIDGYERVKVSGGDYLVPLLFPTALKLEQAAFAAMDEGYKLKIYDSYRPRQATVAIYNQTKSLAETPIPEKTFSGKPMEEMPVLAEGEVLTYGDLMTDFGRYSLNYFLAAGGSNHNMGIAMDMTLIYLNNGKDVKMQSDIHDLSWYSETQRNNSYARKLAAIMKEAGFGTLVSEWWHFEDTVSKSALDLEYTYSGVTPEGWMKNDIGWRYRRYNGSFYKDCTATIENTQYTFDSNGFLVES